MGLILNIETSTAICSVCLAHDGKLLCEKKAEPGLNHASILSVFIRQLFEETELKISQLDAVAVSAGPGSYTGLRIGVTTAKGLCYALDMPLIALDSLLILATGLKKKWKAGRFLFCPTIDARRDEIYLGLFGNHGDEIQPSSNLILSASIPFVIQENKVIAVGGSGAAKCRTFWKNPFLVFDEETIALSSDMTLHSEERLLAGQFEDPRSFEPNYIKPVHILAKSNATK